MMNYGEIIGFEQHEQLVVIRFEHEVLHVECLMPEVVHINAGERDLRVDSFAVIEQPLSAVQVLVRVESDCLLLETKALHVRIFPGGFIDFYDHTGVLLCADFRGQRDGFLRPGINHGAEAEGHCVAQAALPHAIEVVKTMQGDEHFYGLGDKTGFLNKRGYAYEMWNTDDPTPHVESHKALYKSVPFMLTLRDVGAFGLFFDNTFKTYFDLGKENRDYYYFGADQGRLNYYFIAGPLLTDVVQRYTQLTGRAPLPQLWTLGYHQSRWSYENADRVQALVAKFRAYEIPLDCVHLDIDYMDAFKVFTWDHTRFPQPAQMVTAVGEQGVKVVTIIDPAIKKEQGYFAFDEGVAKQYFAKDKDGLVYINKVWPGAAAFPDFSSQAVRTWWSEQLTNHVACGLAGIWNDMNEPASFEGELPLDVQFQNDGRPTTHAEIHNVYGHLMSQATYEGLKAATNKRPFVITRGAYAGSQRYTTFWTGDNHSFWEHLRLAIPQQLNLGLSGFALVGTDVGGFGSDTTAELLVRWSQVGAFSPLFRNHSSVLTREQEPFAFDEATLSHVRAAIQLRYRLLPYFYDLLWSMQTTGLPLLRPLVLHYQTDPNVQQLSTQFLLGEALLVAPVIEQGMRERLVYLPAGTWYDYWQGTKVTGGQSLIAQADLGTIPMYVKAGSIIPHYPVQNYVGEQVIEQLTLLVYPGFGQYCHYEDDGESFNYQTGLYRETLLQLTPTTLTIQ
ncbi:MAG: TIM-barrel domain-containing protein, partial [Culicoidibacterales bacterium]